MAPITTIRNLGPAMAAQFARADIHDADTVRELGADAAYARLLAAGHRAHFMAFTALVLGLQGRGFRDLDPSEKPPLRARFDAIKDAAGPSDPATDVDAALAEIGVLPRKA
ncbi:MAG: TfoX/Sxy family protein [Rhodobacteraceae bacterium]|nr:TfoX/Sxy family protein [Paracoccaceae bacterium]